MIMIMIIFIQEMYLKISSAKWRLFLLSVLTRSLCHGQYGLTWANKARGEQGNDWDIVDLDETDLSSFPQQWLRLS